MNLVILIGNVGKDPEIRATRGGSKIASFSLATSRPGPKDPATGERKKVVHWHNVVVFNEHLVTLIERYVTKGSKLAVVGEVQTRKWQDQSGSDRWTTEIVLDGFRGNIELLGDPKGDAHEDSRPASRSSRRPASADLDDEIPF
ncbi:single-stranded DNA-binding protein [Blastochloris tepida]|uniref:Single-stranded DNA-binding protein n=1 Tax=Blastochloris tepida TaxID=2233851 RepID=A0A348FZC0_9HYPH|nr:single-stranded DNA-binding protein [Blastochloris tepida]BBF92653.1 single-stranded DNA-binding protein [Blastochloris tepida]